MAVRAFRNAWLLKPLRCHHAINGIEGLDVPLPWQLISSIVFRITQLGAGMMSVHMGI